MSPAATGTTTAATLQQILTAIQTLSDRMDAQGIASSVSMDTRFRNQDEMTALRGSVRIDPIAMRLDSIDRTLKTIDDRLGSQDAIVRVHDKDIAQLKAFCDDQVKPALIKVTDIRIELAKLGAAGGGFGLVVAAVLAVGKASGWW